MALDIYSWPLVAFIVVATLFGFLKGREWILGITTHKPPLVASISWVTGDGKEWIVSFDQLVKHGGQTYKRGRIDIGTSGFSKMRRLWGNNLAVGQVILVTKTMSPEFGKIFVVKARPGTIEKQKQRGSQPT